MDHLKLFSSLSSVFLLPCLLGSTYADLNSDKQALLAFAAAVHHGRRLNWNSNNSSMCSSWVGVRCTVDQTQVFALRLPGIGLSGQIPVDTLGKLDALRILSLRSNQLAGGIPPDVLSLPSLHYLYLQHNNLSGNIPALLSSGLKSLDLSYNSFTGEISYAVQNLTELIALNLQNNSFSGPIPDLKLPKLRQLNLSYNNLNGSIPSSLQKFTNDSFIGNSLLCGPPLVQCTAILPSPSPSPMYPPLSSPPASPPKHKKFHAWAIIAIAAGGLALLLLFILILVIFFLKKNGSKCSRVSKGNNSTGGKSEKPTDESSSAVQGAEKNKLFFFEGSAYNFDLEDLLRASAEVLGKGNYGTAYKAVLEDGTTVVVKRLKDVVVGKKEFEQQMEIIGRVGQHLNLMRLRAYYYSSDEKLLVSDYIPNDSFSVLLHGNRGNGRKQLDWNSRLKIMLGTARGIAHIHSVGGAKFSHGNIKSSNILLTQDLDARLSDYGLAPLMNFPKMPSRVVPGYRAPEAIETRKLTHKSDIYSFGVLLLEMLTGKAPLQSLGHDDVVDLPRWVQSVVREEWTAEVFDVELMKNQNNEEQMVQMLQLALACVARVPDQRPTIEEVVSMIEQIQHSTSDSRPPSEKPKGSSIQVT